MSAAVLREAAALMRSRAEVVTETDYVGTHWVAAPTHDPANKGWRVDYAPEVESFDSTLVVAEYDYDGSLAAHLSGWHPAVALAVARLLEAVANHVASHDCEAHCEPGGCAESRDAYDLARAYLGDQS